MSSVLFGFFLFWLDLIVTWTLGTTIKVPFYQTGLESHQQNICEDSMIATTFLSGLHLLLQRRCYLELQLSDSYVSFPVLS